jgi:hypothetical protein
MLLTMAFILCVASVALEVQLVTNIDWLCDKYVNGWTIPVIGLHVPDAWFNNGCSLMLSGVLGIVFQAQGTALMLGGIMSIPASNWFFSAKGYLNSHGITKATTKTAIATHTTEVGKWWATNGHYFVDLAKTIMALIKFVTIPIRAVAKANSAAHEGHGKVIEMRDHAKKKVDMFSKSEFAYQVRDRWASRKAA